METFITKCLHAYENEIVVIFIPFIQLYLLYGIVTRNIVERKGFNEGTSELCTK